MEGMKVFGWLLLESWQPPPGGLSVGAGPAIPRPPPGVNLSTSDGVWSVLLLTPTSSKMLPSCAPGSPGKIESECDFTADWLDYQRVRFSHSVWFIIWGFSPADDERPEPERLKI